MSRLIALILFSVLFSACSVFKGKPAGMQVISNIPASVSVDGKEVGGTPFQSSEYGVKKYAIKVTPKDTSNSSYETSLKLFSGYVAQLDWNFGKSESESSGVTFEYDSAHDKQKAEVQLVASPDNVPVSVDGKNVGFTPLLLEDLSEGNHSIVFQAPGYEEFSRTVKLIKGTRIMMTVKLAKLPTPPAIVPEATESAALVESTSSAKKATPTPKATAKATATPKPTVKPSATPVASASATPQAQSNGAVKKSTSQKPYVEILTTETGFLRVRQSPESGTELYKLAIGSTVPYANASSSAGWLKVTYDEAKVGWVSGQYAKLVQ